MYQLQNFQFPKNFKFAIADADLQVMGEQHSLKEEKSELTMWTHFAKNTDHVYQHHSPMEGIDRFHHWKGDIKLMQQLGVKHYRTSISMARVMTKDQKPNMKAVDWYKRYFESLREAGISVYATLYHWELPLYLHEKGGWKNREIINYMAEHAKIVHTYLGKYIEEYFILNEPLQFTLDSYHTGWDAPYEANLKDGLLTVHHALLAQGKMFQVIRGLDAKAKLSTTFNPFVLYAASASAEDIKATQYAWAYFTGLFTDPLYLGKYPDQAYELFGNKMPKIHSGDMETIKIGGLLHTFGINHYLGKTVRFNPKLDTKSIEVKYEQGVRNGLQWPVYTTPTYPEALYDLLREMYYRYGSYGMKQIYITENGTCWNDTVDSKGEVNDEFRIFYLREQLRQIQKAILAGIPVNGYFLWTFMDNFEWNHGYKPESCFGIVYVDRKTMKRTPKKSYYWYKDVIKNRQIR